MLTEFKIYGFRGFREFSISPLARLNLIAGKNGVGKTALLEALWLFFGPDLPDLGFRIDGFRGLSVPSPTAFMENIFYEFAHEKSIRFEAEGDWDEHSRSLRIELQERETTEFRLVPSSDAEDLFQRSSSSVSTSNIEVVFTYSEGTERDFVSKGWYAETLVGAQQLGSQLKTIGMQSQRDLISGRSISIFQPARLRANSDEDAKRFGQMQLEGSDGDVIDALRHIEPRLKELKIIPTQNGSLVHADLGGTRLVPLPLLGDGMARLFSLTTAFSIARDGAVMIDEIENGLHYSVMPQIWDSLASLASRFNVQLFATTHSQECVLAAHKIFKEREKSEFAYFRLDQTKAGIKAKTYDEEMLETASKLNFEVR